MAHHGVLYSKRKNVESKNKFSIVMSVNVGTFT